MTSDYSFTGPNIAAVTAGVGITTKGLTASMVAPDKVYDGTTAATPTITITNGLVGNETVGVSGTATFNSKDVLTANLVTVTSTTLTNGVSSGLASDYSPAAGQTDVSHITPKSLTASLSGIANKTYDGLLSATVATSLIGVLPQDAVAGVASGLYADRNVGTAIPVTVTGISLSGVDSSNYLATLPNNLATTGTITQLGNVDWVGGATGNWSQASNWALSTDHAKIGAIPDGTNVASVSIPTGANVIFDSAVAATTLSSIASLGQLSMNSGTLRVNGTLITDAYIQTGGTLSVGGDMSVLSNFSKASGATGSLALTGGTNVINIVQAANSGNLVFFDDKPLRLGTVTAYGGSINIDTIGLLQVLGTITAPATSITNGSGVTQTSDIRLAAHSPLTVDAPITASGKITLIGGATIGTGDNVTINAAVTSTAGGNISVQAGDNVVQNANLSTNGGAITTTAETGNLTMATSAQSNSGGGAIAYNAPAGNLTTGGINAGTGSISIDAGSNVVTNGVIASSGSGGTTINAGGGLAINAPINASGNGNIKVSAVKDVAQNANVSSQGGTIAATAVTGNVVMAPTASTSSYGGTITYFAPDGNMTLAKLDAGPTGNIELDAMGSIGPALGLVGPMLTGAAASIEAGGDVVITQALKRIDIDTPGRITSTDTVTNTTIFVLSDVEQAVAATSTDTSTQSLIAATEDARTTVGDNTLGIGGQTVAEAGSTAVATTGGTSGSFGEDKKSEDEKKKEAEAKGTGGDSGTTGSAAKAVKTCT
ncbi:MAG: hypothetical protein IPO38_11330 [Rhodocyclaceae bacterium]|nr:hypothetical protein [Rhodocyclaceae bacterium]